MARLLFPALLVPVLLHLFRPAHEAVAIPRPVPPPDCPGCSDHAEAAGELGVAEFERLLDAYAREPVTGETHALETLLFHGTQARALLAGREARLDPERLAFLRRQLAFGAARIELRVVDESGAVRVRLDPRVVPLGIKQHLHPDASNGVRPPGISGTVRRVGVHHVWTRL